MNTEKCDCHKESPCPRPTTTTMELAEYVMEQDMNVRGPGKDMYHMNKILAEALIEAEKVILAYEDGLIHRYGNVDNIATKWLKKYGDK